MTCPSHGRSRSHPPSGCARLLTENWIAVDAALLTDFDAWLAGGLEWTPDTAYRPVTRADQIDAVLEGVRAGRLVPFEAGDFLHYEDALDAEVVRVLTHSARSAISEVALERAVAALDDETTALRRVPCDSAPLTCIVLARLQAQVAETRYWSKQLGRSKDADLYHEELGHYWEARKQEEAAPYVEEAARIISEHR